jgi:hypothetical protein
MTRSIEARNRPWTLAEYAGALRALTDTERGRWLAVPVFLLAEGLMVPFDADDDEDSTVGAKPPAFASKAIHGPDQNRMLIPLALSSHNPTTRRVTVGRSAACDVIVAFDAVSKVHAYLHAVGPDSVEIEDAGSTNGTFLEGKSIPVGTRARVSDGNAIVLGRIVVEFRSATRLAPQVLALTAT